ncbi:cell division initiation protein [Streptomyces sp. A7024]|uniref:Cell division initiation protein n=1 Tax=Streptomyces coryli TaxID=1128680 RepID=A0A6G4U457_9ACTN|nr:cell division initiation protein [Streptomyces coryli]NGN66873.1 cell division initiation protein [Streptomyces coryli]
MDVQKKLDDIVAAVEGARSMPMSASCVINRTELLELLDEVRQALPGSLAQAQELIGGREQVVEQARAEAERIIEQAQAQRGELISHTEVASRAQAEAERILAEAQAEAEEVRAAADDYVDSKLANFEVVLTKTIGSVDRGRAKLLGMDDGVADYDQQYDPNAQDPGYDEAPERSHDPETLRRRADEYVEKQFGAFEAVLSKTLEAVGRGRQKLEGRAKPIEELTAHIAGSEERDRALIPHQTGSEEGFLADYAERPETQQPQPQHAQPQPQHAQPRQEQQPAYYDAGAGYQPYQDPYQQQGGYDPAAYQQQSYDQGYQQQTYDQQGYGQHQQPQHQQAAALDETSLFDTSMINLDELRRYEEGQDGGR